MIVRRFSSLYRICFVSFFLLACVFVQRILIRSPSCVVLRDVSHAAGTKAIETNDQYVKAYMRRATCGLEIEKEQEAVRDLEKAKELDPSNRFGFVLFPVCGVFPYPFLLLPISLNSKW